MASIAHVFISATFFLSLVLLALSSPLGSKRILGGISAKQSNYPYIVSIRNVSGTTPFEVCGGSIISEKFILTAARCIENPLRLEAYKVVPGTHIANGWSNAPSHSVKRVFMLPEFNTLYIQNDIALIELTIPMQFTENVTKIELDGEYVGANLTGVISGRGDNFHNFHIPSSGELLYVRMVTMSNGECAAKMPITGRHLVHSTALCAHGQILGIGLSKGDIGGPFVLNNKLIGVASLPYMSYTNWQYPDVFTRISAYKEWIQHILIANP